MRRYVAMGIAVLTLTHPIAALAASEVTYRNDEYGLSIKVPKNWSIQDKKEVIGEDAVRVVRFIAPAKDNEDVITAVDISVSLLPDPSKLGRRKQLDVKQVIQLALKALKKARVRIRVLQEKPMKLAGFRARMLVHEITNDLGEIVKGKEVDFITGNAFVSLSLSTTPKTFPEYEKIFGRMLKTLTLEQME